jgi:hypothetical protein
MASFGTVPQIADYLNNGYWAWAGAGPRHWAVGATVSVNITDLMASEQSLAMAALNAWHEIANINFSFTSGAAQITYRNDGSGQAYSSSSVSGSTITSSLIDISSDWWPNTNIYSYMYQTYLHETGHALGLGHSGPYNGSATYGVNNVFTNDTWQWTLMSYFPQDRYGGSSYDYVITPQMADIYAMQAFYGAQTTRAADTVYGFHSTAGALYDFASYAGTPAFTIYDSGGIDMFDASGYSVGQTVDLRPGTWSSIGGYTNNIGMYMTSVIERAIGGGGSDNVVGNDADNRLYGLAGNDLINGQLGNDTAVYSGARSQYQITKLAQNALQVADLRGGAPDGSDTDYNIEFFEFADRTYAFNELVMADLQVRDANGDNRSDTVMYNDNGQILYRMMNGAQVTSSQSPGSLGAGWHIEGFGDFDGDRKSGDMFLKNDSGSLSFWMINSGQLVTTQSPGGIGTDWHVRGTGDFNADGKTDVFLQNDGGHLVFWMMNGGQVAQSYSPGMIGAEWHVRGVGDFNGDGKADVFLQNDAGHMVFWMMNGGQVAQSQTPGRIGAEWNVRGVADFNADGKDDIFLQDTAGHLVFWTMNGGQVAQSQTPGILGSEWHVREMGDFNGDAKSDVLLQNDAGQLVYWMMNGGEIAQSVAGGSLTPDWHLV